MRYWLEVNTFEFIREVDKLNTPKEQQQKLADMAAYASIPVSYTHLDVYKRQVSL